MKRTVARSVSSVRGCRKKAADLGAVVPAELLDEGTLAAIAERPRGEAVAIACSGGADSVALLLLLWRHLPERRGRWLVLHFDHRLRGAASSGDARFVRALARRLGERCVIGRWVDKPVVSSGRISEAEARDARWRFMAEAMRSNGARVIALGHQLDDVAETMLMRLTRGSGSAGLAAPRPVQRMADGTVRVRPLLRLSAGFLREMLRKAGATWREDATNATDGFFRNRVRRRVLPALVDAAQSNALCGFGDARSQLEEDNDALEEWLEGLVKMPRGDGEPCDLSPLANKPVALLRRAIHRWGSAVGLTPFPPKAAVDALIGAIRSWTDQRLSTGVGRFIVLRSGRLSLVAAGHAALRGEPWPKAQLWANRELIGPRGDRVEMRMVRLTRMRWASIRAGGFPRDTVAYLDPGPDWPGWLWVGSWQPGDRYRPLGASGRSKLQDLFVNRRVPRELRPLLPVLLNNTGNVLWVPGLPIADTVAIQPTAKLVVQLTYRPAPPMVNRPKRLLS